MALTHIQREALTKKIAQKARGVWGGLKNINGAPSTNERSQDALNEFITLERMQRRIKHPIKNWNFGVSALSATSDVTPRGERHLLKLAQASAMFDQFCVGVTVNPETRRLFIALRRLDLTEKSLLPEIDTITQVLDELSVNSPASTFYLNLEHEDKSATWFDFGGASPVELHEEDMPHCTELLEDYADGFVLVYGYHASTTVIASTQAALTNAVGVTVEGKLQTRHELSIPFREEPMDSLTRQVGHFYRSLQTGRTTSFVPPSELNKRRAAAKASRKASRKSRKRG